MTRQPLVLHLVTGLNLGGAERHVEELATRGTHRAVVVTCYQQGPIAERLRAAGVPVHHLGGTGPGDSLRTAWRLHRLVRRLRPDVVHTHLLSAQALGIPVARLAGVPVVLSTEHSLMDAEIEGRPLSWRLRLVYRALEAMTTRTVAVSEATAGRLVALGVRRRRIVVVDNPIDLDGVAAAPGERDAVRAELGLPAGAQVVGAVGRLDPVKHLDVLVEAVAPLLGPDRHLLVAGRGPLHAELTAQAERLGVAPWVHLVGAREDLRAVLSAMDVFVSPSRDETFGMAVVEAAASGLPVVHGQCPALEVLGEGRSAGWTALGPAADRAAEVAVLRAALRADLPGAVRDPGAVDLLRRYDARSVVATVDALYRDLPEAS